MWRKDKKLLALVCASRSDVVTMDISDQVVSNNHQAMPRRYRDLCHCIQSVRLMTSFLEICQVGSETVF